MAKTSHLGQLSTVHWNTDIVEVRRSSATDAVEGYHCGLLFNLLRHWYPIENFVQQHNSLSTSLQW